MNPLETDYVSWPFAFACLAVALVGFSKSGLGGGSGILATPLIALVFDPRAALGILLPLLILSDWVALWFYRRSIHWRAVAFFLPGCLVGIALGGFLLGRVDDLLLRQILGGICLAFCLLQAFKTHVLRSPERAIPPGLVRGIPIGTAAGCVSTLAHAAGPVAAMFLLPLKMEPRVFMGTTVAAFTAINVAKLPAYLHQDVIDPATLPFSLALAPAMVLGTLIGVWLNHRIARGTFTRAVYIILFFAGLSLLFSR